MWQSDERSELIRAVKQRGEAVPTVAARLGVPVSTAYRWLRVAPTTRTAIASPTFVELIVDHRVSAPLVVRVGAAEIEVQAGFDRQLLRDVVAALGTAA
jgi:transposase-like protein